MINSNDYPFKSYVSTTGNTVKRLKQVPFVAIQNNEYYAFAVDITNPNELKSFVESLRITALNMVQFNTYTYYQPSEQTIIYITKEDYQIWLDVVVNSKQPNISKSIQVLFNSDVVNEIQGRQNQADS